MDRGGFGHSRLKRLVEEQARDSEDSTRERVRRRGVASRAALFAREAIVDEARARFDSVRSRYALSGRAGSWPWAFETYRLAQLERRAGRFDAASG